MADEFEKEKMRLLAEIQKQKSDKQKSVAEKRLKLKQSQISQSSSPPLSKDAVSGANLNMKVGFYSQSKLFKDQMGNALKTLASAYVDEVVEKMLDWMETNKPQFVFIDVDLPTKWVDAMDVFTNGSILCGSTKFVVVTGNMKDSVVMQMIRKNASAILPKPVKLTDIKGIIQGNVPPHCMPENY